MKNKVLLIIALCSLNATFAQFYVSGNVGYSMGSAGILTGTSLNESQTEATNHYGSFGEGMNVQLRGGYSFNEMFGVELGFAYLNGADQNTSSYETNDAGAISEYTNSTAHARAYGLTAALTYNFNEHFYGKIGMVTKLGGKTEAEFTKTTNTLAGPIVTTGVNDYHGRIPLGFTASFGYKYKLGENWNVFAELEYLGINVTRDTSEFAEFNMQLPAALGGTEYTLSDLPIENAQLGIYVPKEIEYVDSLPVPNDDPKKELSSVAPYSSFGLNIGITYTFSKKEKS